MKERIKFLTAIFVAAATALTSALAADPAFSFRDTPADHFDILAKSKPIARYMYSHDVSTPENAHQL